MVCHGKRLREEPVDEVFNAADRYVLVTGMPSTVYQDCGERSFSHEATELARLLVHDPPADATAKSVPQHRGMGVRGRPRRSTIPVTRASRRNGRRRACGKL